MSGHPARSRKFQLVTAMVGALLLSSGFALMAGVGSASAADEECVPKDAHTETTDWVDESPGPGWYQVDERTTPGTPEVPEVVSFEWQQTVVDQPGTDPVYKDWGKQRYSYTPRKGAPKVPPAWSTPLTDSTNWQKNTTNYNGTDPLGVVWVEGQGHSASWFYWTVKQVLVTPGSDPTYKAIYEWAEESPGEGWTKTGESKVVQEYVPGTPDVTEYKFAFDHPAVTCEDVEPPTEPPVEPPVDEPMDDPVDQPVTGPTDSQVAGPKAPAEEPSGTTQQESVAGPTVPSKVDAGLTVGSTDTSAQGLGLAGAGVLLLAAAGVTAARKRTGDVDA